MSDLMKAVSTAEALAETHSKTADGLQFAPVVRDHYRDAADALRRLAKEVPNLEADNARLREALTEFREHVIRHAKVWADGGGSHHHPIWQKVTDALEGRE